MSLLNEIGSMFSGQDAQRIAAGNGNFQDPNSPDTQQFQNALPQADQGQLAQVFGQSAQQMNPQEYAEHITPGAGGTNPLAGIGRGGLATIASTLMQHLTGSGLAGGLLGRITGLNTTNPQQMDENQVAALSRYTQQNHPDIFGRVAAQIGQQKPDLLHSFLGKAGLAIGAAALARHFMGRSQA
jgi:hypothetical protein